MCGWFHWWSRSGPAVGLMAEPVFDADVATQVARETHLNCVTMQGDQVSKKGAMTGGFLDLRFSKMGAWRGLR